MAPTSEAHRNPTGVALAALLLVALATLVAGCGRTSSASDVPAMGREGSRRMQALDALRTISSSTFHRVARVERSANGSNAHASPVSTVVLALIGAACLASSTSTAARDRRRWWGGRCWRAPPVAVTA